MLAHLYRVMRLQSLEEVVVEDGDRAEQVDIPLEGMVISMMLLHLDTEAHRRLEVQEGASVVLMVHIH